MKLSVLETFHHIQEKKQQRKQVAEISEVNAGSSEEGGMMNYQSGSLSNAFI